MSEDRKPFTVNDRRHFTADGQARVAENQAAAAPADPAKPAPAVAPNPVPGGEAAPDFAGFLISLGTQAGMFLSGQTTEDVREGLRGAQQIISILEMLKTKTEGRRTAEEDQVLDGLLYELRLAYVAAVREAKA